MATAKKPLKPLKNHKILSFFILTLALANQHAQAQPFTQRYNSASEFGQTIGLDTLEEKWSLTQGKIEKVDPATKSVFVFLKYFEAKQWAEAIKVYDSQLKSKSRLNPPWLDHVLFAVFKSHLALISESDSIITRKKTENLSHIVEAQKAFDLLKKEFPYSPYYKLLDLLESTLLWKKAQISGQTAAFESALQVLALEGNLNRLTLSQLKHYGTLAIKKPTELTRFWALRIAQVFSKGTAEGEYWYETFEVKYQIQKWSSNRIRTYDTYKAPDKDQVAFDLAFALFSQGKTKEAQIEFEKFLTEFPRSTHKNRARFWLSQCYAKSGKVESAKGVLNEIINEAPFSFYGLSAALIAKATPEAVISAQVPEVVRIDPNLTPLEAVRLQKAELLLNLGLTKAAAFELKEIKPKDTFSSPFIFYLAALHNRAANHLNAFQCISELMARNYGPVFSTYGRRFIFPVVYLPAIQKATTAVNLDSILFLSLIKQESSFESDIQSPVGAIGLSQLMPTTAFETLPGIKREELNDPQTNLTIGAKYLKQMLTKFNGNMAMALAAYNAGPNAVARWVKKMHEQKQDLSIAEFIEQIPVRETRDYVGSIIRNYFWYSKYLQGEAPPTLDFFWGTGTKNPVELPPLTD